MTDLDERITQTLSDDDRAFLDSLDAERGLFTQLGDSWKGPMGGWAKLITGFSVAMGLLLLFVVWQVANTREPIAHTLWAISGVGLLVILGFAKDWLFQRMNMLTILREVKRLQLELAMLREEVSREDAEG